MKLRIIAAIAVVAFCSMRSQSTMAAQTALNITIPLSFGEHHVHEPAQAQTAADVRAERRLRMLRYGFQLADAIVSAIGYRAYAKCLSCLAFPGGGPVGSGTFGVRNLTDDRPAEVDPLIQPFSRGGLGTLAIATLAYDIADARVERHWSAQRRSAADLAEIGGHAWGLSTWIPEIKNIHRDERIAAGCGAQWSSKAYGQAFTDGCVNEFYRPSGSPVAPATAKDRMVVCAPARFKNGTYLFSTISAQIFASGSPCPAFASPFR
jgi:hypothetical protein